MRKIHIFQSDRLFKSLGRLILTNVFVYFNSLSSPVFGHAVLMGAIAQPERMLNVQYTFNFEIEANAGPGAPVAFKISVPPLIADEKGVPTAPRFLMFRGLPDQFSFSSGFRIRQSWVVSVKDLGRLQLAYPPDFAGTVQLQVVVHGAEGVPLLNSLVAVPINAPVVKPSQVLETALAKDGVSGRPEPPREPVQPKWNAAEQARLLQRGHSLMGTGNIAAARMVLEGLAEQGNANAAFAMGQSYEPDYLRRLNVIGSLPDIAQARKWYLRAAELGSEMATSRLAALAE